MADRDRDPRREIVRNDSGDYEADEIQPYGLARQFPVDSTRLSAGDSGRRGRFYGVGPKGYRRSDARILEEMSDRLMTHPDVDASDIEVQVANGIITLTGTVPDRHQKRIADLIAEDIVGVDDVHNELHVRHGFWSSLAGGRADEASEHDHESRNSSSDRAAPAARRRD